MKTETNITGIILAGGKSSRMGSDKGFLEINGESFIQHIIAALTPLVKEIIIVSDNADYDAFGYKRVDDIIKNAGPLAGLFSGLSNSETEINLVLSCDVPLINDEVLQCLIAGCDDASDIVQIKSGGRTMPLIAIYKKNCAADCLKLLEGGERRLRKLAENRHIKTIVLEPKLDHFVRNINTLEELKEVKHEFEN